MDAVLVSENHGQVIPDVEEGATYNTIRRGIKR
jgi:hypothetical protein